VRSVKKHDEQNLKKRETHGIFSRAASVIVPSSGKSTWYPLTYFVC